jgi:hypothetical protein
MEPVNKLIAVIGALLILTILESAIYQEGYNKGVNSDPRNSNNITTICQSEYQRGITEQNCKLSREIFALCTNKTEEVYKCKAYNCTLTNQAKHQCEEKT